jgi:hypothetical protein
MENGIGVIIIGEAARPSAPGMVVRGLELVWSWIVNTVASQTTDRGDATPFSSFGS